MSIRVWSSSSTIYFRNEFLVIVWGKAYRPRKIKLLVNNGT